MKREEYFRQRAQLVERHKGQRPKQHNVEKPEWEWLEEDPAARPPGPDDQSLVF